MKQIDGLDCFLRSKDQDDDEVVSDDDCDVIRVPFVNVRVDYDPDTGEATSKIILAGNTGLTAELMDFVEMWKCPICESNSGFCVHQYEFKGTEKQPLCTHEKQDDDMICAVLIGAKGRFEVCSRDYVKMKIAPFVNFDDDVFAGQNIDDWEWS